MMRADDFPADQFPMDLLFLNLEDYDVSADEPSAKDTPNMRSLASKEQLLVDLEDCIAESMLIQASPPEKAMIKVEVSTPTQAVSHPSSATSTPAPSNPGSPRATKRSTPLSQSPSAVNTENSSNQKLPRHKRKSHISAELRRRSKIQRGLEDIQTLVPAVAEALANGQKESKAAILNKTLNFGLQLRSENKALSKEADKLRAEIQALSMEINGYQKQLPDGGVGVVPKSVVTAASNRALMSIEKMFDDYVRARTFQNWKFWIFGMIIRPLFNSYNQQVRTSSFTEFGNSILSWLDKHCSLVVLRSGLLSTLRSLSKQSSILTAPEQLPEEAIQAALAEPELTLMAITPDATSAVTATTTSSNSSSFIPVPVITSEVERNASTAMISGFSPSSPIMEKNASSAMIGGFSPSLPTMERNASSAMIGGFSPSSPIMSIGQVLKISSPSSRSTKAASSTQPSSPAVTSPIVTSTMSPAFLPSFTPAAPATFSIPLVTSTTTSTVPSIPIPGSRSASVTSPTFMSSMSPAISSALLLSLSSSPVTSVESMITSMDDLDAFPC